MRRNRMGSESGLYHVMVRGVAQCAVFYDERDDKRFLGLLRKYMDEHEVEMHAWCLMENHVHLLPRAPSREALARFMHDVCGSYAMYFNKRYGRAGHLLQGRFLSKPVSDDQYLLTVVRYIHQNPIGPRLSPTCDYRWSSYQEYIGKYDPVIATTDFVLSLFGGLGEFIAFHAEDGEPDGSLDPVQTLRGMSDAEVRAIARDVLGCEPAMLQSFSRGERNTCMHELRCAGLSFRQIESVTGIPRSTLSSAEARRSATKNRTKGPVPNVREL